MKIAITGATGLIGTKLSNLLKNEGHEITVLTRNPNKAKAELPNADNFVEWTPNQDGEWQKAIDGKDALVHLAGENLMSSRWTEEHKKNIRNSRVIGAKELIKAIEKAENKPEVFATASAIGYYGRSASGEVTEESDPGDDFLAGVISELENETAKVEELGVRKVNVRIGVVLDKNGGALARMLPPFKFFIGGPLGTGKQWFPWVHIDDVINLFHFTLTNRNVKGPVNAVAPNSMTMEEFTNTLGKVLHRPSFFKVPEFVLNIILGEAASVVTKGVNIKPKRTLEYGYKFKFTDVEKALRDLLI
jgi:hypothetical protein